LRVDAPSISSTGQGKRRQPAAAHRKAAAREGLSNRGRCNTRFGWAGNKPGPRTATRYTAPKPGEVAVVHY
jgi:hypothetical protein